jgi:hypothetical protein
VKGYVVEVKIGVQHIARDIVLESTQSRDELTAAITEAVSKSALLTLTDEKGRTVIVPGDRLAYVELGSPERGRVGFGA